MRSRIFSGLWANPDFFRLWTAQTTSVFGSLIGLIALQFTAIIWLDASAGEVAVLGAAQLVPAFAFSFVAGVWVDRLPRRPIMIAADVGRAVALFSVPIMAVFDLLTIWQLYVVAGVTSTLSVFFASAYRAYLPTLVDKEALIEGNAKLHGTASVVEVMSFSFSGWLVQALRAPGAVGINAATFVLSAFAIWRIKTPEPAPPGVHERSSFLTEAREGFTYVMRDRYLRPLAISMAIQSMGDRVLTVVYLLYLSEEVGFSPGVLGMIFAVGGVTSVFGAWLANRGTLFFGAVGPTIAISAFMRAGGTLFMPLAADTGWLGIAFLVANQIFVDPFWTLFEIHEVSMRQSVAPERMQGRLFANFHVLEFGFALVGTAVAGVLGGLIGFRETLFVAVGLMFVAALVIAISPIARIGRLPKEPEVVAV